MKTATLRRSSIETAAQYAGPGSAVGYTAGMSLACSAEEQRLCSWFTRARELMVLWRMRVRVRNELIMLSDGDLHDIGWTRAEVKAEHRKPFWRT